MVVVLSFELDVDFVVQFLRMYMEGVGIFWMKVLLSGRRFFLGGNWKCNGNVDFIMKLVKDFNVVQFEDFEDVEIVVCLFLVYIDYVVILLMDCIEVGVQNCWIGKMGVFMGEMSVEQLVDFGVKWVVVGYVEWWYVLGEFNFIVVCKVFFVLL